MPATFTTTLPDAQTPSLSNGVEDEVGVDWTDVVNYGNYDIQIRETGTNSWDSNATGFEETVQGEATTSIAFTNKEDGEEYEVRMRTQTEHVTGTWTTPTAIVTKFPGITNYGISATGVTSVDLSWSDNADNEDGFEVQRRRLYGSSWTPWEVIDTLAPNTTTYTDTTPQPDATYQYRVRTYTEHSSMTTPSDQTTTNVTGLHQTPVRSTGWTVEVERSDGQVRRPTIIGDPQWVPRLNDLPKVRIPVIRNETWTNRTGETMRVYYDGQRLPIDQLENVRTQPGQTILEGRGALELLGRTTKSVVSKQAHLVAEDIIQADTSYTANVDTPAATAEEDVSVQTADTQVELENNLAAAIPATDPLYVEAGQAHLGQTLWFAVWDDTRMTRQGGFDVYEQNSDRWIDGHVIEDPSWVDVTFETKHTIPAAQVGIGFRTQQPGDGHPGFHYYLDINDTGSYDETVATVSADALVTGETEPDWFTQGGITNDLPPGTHRAIINFDNGASAYANDTVYIDAGSLFDSRYYGALKTNVTNSHPDGPPLYGTPWTVEFADANPASSVVGGYSSITIDDTTGQQAVAISNDSGATWTEAVNSDSVRTDWGTPSSTIRTRVTLAPWGVDTSNRETPTHDFKGQKLDAYNLMADLQDIPILEDWTADDQTKTVLNDIADITNSIWEARWTGSGIQIEWTQPGQRTAERSDTVFDYDIHKNVEESYEKAVIKGVSRPIRAESFTSSYDMWVALAKSDLAKASEVVYSGSIQYTRGSDYEMNYLTGEIKVLSTGAMADATSYDIDYSHKSKGEHTASNAGVSPKTVSRSLPSLATDEACAQAALYLIQKTNSPRHSATIEVNDISPGDSLVNSITIPDLPMSDVGKYVQENVENTDRSVRMEVGSRQSLTDLLGDINRRLGQTTQTL